MGSNSFSSWTSSFCLRLPPCWQCNPWVGWSHVISLLIGLVGIAFHSLSLYIHGRTIVRLSIYGWLMSHLVWCEQQQDHPSAPSRIEAEKNYGRRCVRLACQPTSQQYCFLILNQHQPLATSQSAVLFSRNKSTPAKRTQRIESCDPVSV